MCSVNCQLGLNWLTSDSKIHSPLGSLIPEMEEKSKVNFLGFAVLPHCEPLSRDSLGDHWDSSGRHRGFSGSNLGLDSFCTAQEADQFAGANLAEYVFSLVKWE